MHYSYRWAPLARAVPRAAQCGTRNRGLTFHLRCHRTPGAAASLESLTVVEAREGPLLTLCQIINRLGAHQRSHSFSAKPSSLRVHFLDLGET
jgi:hypothetical protein